MDKLWAGRFAKELDSRANDFNSSIRVDSRMVRQDIKGSIAHATMLGATDILPQSEVDMIVEGLQGILADIDNGSLPIDMTAEDVHMFVENELTRRLGDTGKRLHTARSRNDQVAVDVRLYLRDEAEEIKELLKNLILVLADLSEENKSVIAPGYTHLQRAQPIAFGHHLAAYAMMFVRDYERVVDAVRRMNVSPLGSCALAGTGYPTNRRMEAALLGFDGITLNSMDGVSDRDFCVELANACALIMTHLSRFSEEVILWASWEFKFIELDDAFSTGSSIMPQKKNPDIAELVRGKSGRVYGNLMALLTMLKGLPLAYNKDMQEDKELIFDSIDTVKDCLAVFAPMLATMRVLPDNMRKAAANGFINATECADYLTRKGLPFRTAYKITGQIVAYSIANGKTLETLGMAEYKEFCADFDEDIYASVDMQHCIDIRVSEGCAGTSSVEQQVEYLKNYFAE
ncbi:MAG: argininosuccinate lyase [Clostridia bacterium]|nr:argininosuccinate lyase [Clostridia bacterium]